MRIIYISAIAVVLLMAMQSCGDKPSDYGMPQWDTDLNLPLTMRTYHLKDLIEEDKYIKIDSLTPGGIYVIYSDTLNKRLGVEDFIKNQFTGDYFNNKFPIFQGEGTAYLSFKNGAEIDSAHFTTGQMKLDVVNPANEALNYTVTVPGLFLPSGTPYSHIGSISPKSFETINEDLTGFSYSARNQTDRSKIRFDIKSNTGYSGDSVLFNMNFSNTNFSYIEGVIPTAELNPINKSLSMPLNPDVLKFRDKIILGDASLKIEAEYQTWHDKIFDVLLKNVRIAGKRTDGSIEYLKDASGSQNLGDITINNGKFERTFDNNNSNLPEFLSFLPDSLVMFANVIMNPNFKRGIAAIEDTIDVKAFFIARSSVKLYDVEFRDTLALEISSDNRDLIKKALKARFCYEITNGLAIDAEMEIGYSDSSMVPFFYKTIKLDAAQTDKDGNSSKPVINYVSIELDSAEIRQVAKSYFTLVRIKASTGSADPAPIFKPEDIVILKSYFQIKYLVNGE